MGDGREKVFKNKENYKNNFYTLTTVRNRNLISNIYKQLQLNI